MELWLNDKPLELIAFIYIRSYFEFMITFLPFYYWAFTLLLHFCPCIIGLLHHSLICQASYELYLVKHLYLILSSCQIYVKHLYLILSSCQTSVKHLIFITRFILSATAFSYLVLCCQPQLVYHCFMSMS